MLVLLVLLVGKGVAARGGNLKRTSWRGVGGEGAAPPPQMHWMSLHLLAARGGNLNVFVLGLHVVLARGVAARDGQIHCTRLLTIRNNADRSLLVALAFLMM